MIHQKNSGTNPFREHNIKHISLKKELSEAKKANRDLRKRITEIKVSRDLWKRKYFDEKDFVKNHPNTANAKYHHYPILWVLLVLELQKYGGMSLRSCRHCLVSMSLVLGLEIKRFPSHSSIRNWLIKVNYAAIRIDILKGGRYIIYVDESIVFGAEKILLILGISQEKVNLNKAVSHEDVEVLYVGFGKEWKAEKIGEKLLKIQENKEISYVVSDQGTNLIKAYQYSKLAHIEDVTYILANSLKKIYNKNEIFDGFCKLIGCCRKSWYLSKEKSRFMPPKMQHKMRFANIFPCVDWANRMLANWQSLSDEIREKLTFLLKNKSFFEELQLVGNLFKSTCDILKNNTFSDENKAKILEKIKVLEGENIKIFGTKIEDYLSTLTTKMNVLKLENLLCSSDVIESIFGKFKCKIATNSHNGLTEFVFTLANFGKNFTPEEVKNGLESVQVKDLKNIKL